MSDFTYWEKEEHKLEKALNLILKKLLLLTGGIIILIIGQCPLLLIKINAGIIIILLCTVIFIITERIKIFLKKWE